MKISPEVVQGKGKRGRKGVVALSRGGAQQRVAQRRTLGAEHLQNDGVGREAKRLKRRLKRRSD